MKDEDGRRREDRDRSSDAQSMPHIPPGTETEEERSLSERIKDWLLGTDDAKVAQEIERGNASALQHLAVAVMILEAATWLMLAVIRPVTLNYRASIASFVWMIAVSAAVFLYCAWYRKTDAAWRGGQGTQSQPAADTRPLGLRLAPVVTVLAAAAMYFAAIIVARRNYVQGRQVLIFHLVTLCFVCFVRFRPLVGALLYADAYVVLYAVLHHTDGAAGILPANYIPYAVAAAAAAVINYRQAVSSVKSRFRAGELMRHLSDMSFHDALTGLLNRHALDVKLNPCEGRLYYVAMADVNQFKVFNDANGHQAGDRVLAEIGRTLHRRFRKTDSYRYGGDEFLVISENIGREAFEQRLFHWKRDVASIRVDGAEDGITISCGTAYGPASSKEELFELIRKADEELMRIRKGDPDAQDEDETIIEDVFEAMERGEVVAFFQPKVDIRDNTLIGAEALVRWKRNNGIVPPGSFLPLLERTGDICRLDLYVFRQVCEHISAWTKAGISVPTISCNFSMKHLANERFAEELTEIADKCGVSHEHLEIEMTETVTPEEISRLNEVIQKLRASGFRTALDDFGTGYSSLSLIKDIPIDVIKLDKSLLSSYRDLTQLEDKDRAMMKHIVGLVQDMQMMCLAEGVETRQQKEFLKSIGCNYVQGFLYDRPLESADFETRLRSGHYAEPEAAAESSRTRAGTDAAYAVNVLLAEDNEINREITVNILESLGANVTAASDGRVALDTFAASPAGTFDMILMDIQMPEMDGYESTRAIRRLDRPDAAAIPIIAVTVDVYRETRERAEAAGMTGYATKPLDPERLKGLLRDVKKK